MQKILGYMRKAIDDYNMIQDGDKIAIGLSGGKDSITLLMGFKNLQRLQIVHSFNVPSLAIADIDVIN